MNEYKLYSYFEQIQHELVLLRERIPEFANDNNMQKVIKGLNTSADIKGKFKITWALLPKLITENTALPNLIYEKEIVWNFKDIVSQIVEDFKGGHLFVKP